jgi:hypothetical protein
MDARGEVLQRSASQGSVNSIQQIRACRGVEALRDKLRYCRSDCILALCW